MATTPLSPASWNHGAGSCTPAPAWTPSNAAASERCRSTSAVQRPRAARRRPAQRRRLAGPYPDAGLADGPAGPDVHYEQREAVELAFIAALQHLPGNQRAALLR